MGSVRITGMRRISMLLLMCLIGLASLAPAPRMGLGGGGGSYAPMLDNSAYSNAMGPSYIYDYRNAYARGSYGMMDAMAPPTPATPTPTPNLLCKKVWTLPK